MSVKLILKEDVESLGKVGDIVSVQPGYARNYLIPKKLGILATLQNLLWLKNHRERLESEAKAKKNEAEHKKDILVNLGDITVAAQIGPTGKLFGRITNKDLTEKISELSSEQLLIAHKDIKIEDYPHGVDELGSYKVLVNLGVGVKANISLIVLEQI
ncbi:MAG: 50S ribosomal protein L9 [Candidatus Caenarcaniphilales bacterium]|nr:50S ribosomal protein L9 [Candidatus Caenarcaniphilales bacterium]